MKNNFLKLLIFIYLYLNFISISFSNEQFKFQITEIDIKENGNIIIGSKGGKATTNNGIEILGDKFFYNKLTNILKVSKNVKFVSKEDGVIIFSDKATYLKNEEIIFTEGNSRALNKEYSLTANKFKYNKKKNILNAEKNVQFLDSKDETKIL